jgi:competence protein ComEA
MKSWQHVLTGLLAGLVIAAGIYIVAAPPHGKALILSPAPTASPLKVFVSGSVTNPGLYQLSLESRVADAIDAAGGFSDTANQEALNLAAKLHDGESIYVPAAGETLELMNEGTDTPFVNQQGDTRLNINAASQEELENLPGIGPSKAAAIISYREENGPFQIIEDINNVPGIGPTIFDQIKDLITVDYTP